MQHATPDPDDLIPVATAARAIGINRSTLSRQVKTGVVRSHGGKVRLREVLADRAAKLDPARRRKRGGPPGALDQGDPSQGSSAANAYRRASHEFGSEFHAGAVWAAQAMTYCAAALAAITAVSCGANMPVAFALKKLMAAVMVFRAAELLHANGVEPFASDIDAPVWSVAAFDDVDWHWLAAEAGESVDFAAWEAFERTLPICQIDNEGV
jgi:hypothetical protein